MAASQARREDLKLETETHQLGRSVYGPYPPFILVVSPCAPRVCVRVYLRVCWCRRIFTYIRTVRLLVTVVRGGAQPALHARIVLPPS